MIAGAAGPKAQREVPGGTLQEKLTQSISRQMVTLFSQGTVCGESTAAQLVFGSRFVCTVEAT